MTNEVDLGAKTKALPRKRNCRAVLPGLEVAGTTFTPSVLRVVRARVSAAMSEAIVGVRCKV